jgi:regulation of enolase protein 1 (concanavalin A-like superfamily)
MLYKEMLLSRRLVIAQGVAGAVFGGATQAASTSSFAGMTWLNEPASVTIEGDRCLVGAKPGTDFWRATYTGTVSDNGHFLFRPMQGGFKITARIQGDYLSRYDQAGIMVRQNPEHWMKCGTEFFAKRRTASIVVTHDYSDWSFGPNPTETGAVWWRVERRKNSLDISLSADGDRFQLTRSCYFAPESPADVGLYCCSPTGQGFTATFDQLQIS